MYFLIHMAHFRYGLVSLIFVLMLLIAPVLAKQADDEDQYKLKDEWKNKQMVKEQQGELTQVVFMLTDVGDPDGDGSQDAYELLGYKWFTAPVKYTINPSTPVKKYKLAQSAVVQAVQNSFETWDAELSLELYDTPTVSSSAKASLSKPDYKNVITWGTLSDRRVIAVTSIWYYTSSKQIIDADMVFNTYYKWGIDKDGEGTVYTVPASTFDIQNIGTHEAGHVCGLGDIYIPTYSAMTMFGYSSYREVSKISLEAGDIIGLQEIY